MGQLPAPSRRDVLRISIDAKALVKIGPFARGGKNRVWGKAADHDLQPLITVPLGSGWRHLYI
jgi:hypothetical protein